MSQWYFLVEKGKTIGPLEREAVDLAIKKGRLGPFDLLYREGEEKWQPTHKFEEFRHLFQGRISASLEDSWIILQKKVRGNRVSYEQRGPYLSDRVRELLQLGEVQYTDFIWREGQREWRRISSLDFFNPPPVKWKPAVALPQDVEIDEVTTGVGTSTKEPVDLSAVTRVRIELDQKKPKEAITEDLTQTLPPAADVVTLPRKIRVPRGAEPRGEISVEARHESSSTDQRFSFLKRIPWAPMISLAGLAVLGTFVYLHREEISRSMGRPASKEAPGSTMKTPPPKAPPPMETPVAKVEPVAKPVSPPTIEKPPIKVEPVVPKVEPTRLKIRIVNRQGSGPMAEFSTDGSFHFPIQATVIGNAGEVLGQVSVYKEVTLRWGQDEKPSLNLTKLGLGAGGYRIVAQIGDFEDEAQFRLGREDRVFRAELDRHRKLISLPFQRERRRIIMAGIELQGLVLRAGSLFQSASTSSSGYQTWKGQLGDWTKRSLGTVNLSNPRTLVFPSLWLELGDLREELVSASEDLESGQPSRIQGAKTAVGQLLNQSHRFVEKSQKLSLFGRGG